MHMNSFQFFYGSAEDSPVCVVNLYNIYHYFITSTLINTDCAFIFIISTIRLILCHYNKILFYYVSVEL